MTLETIRQKIYNFIQASWGTATLVAYPNREFIPPQNASWIRPVIKVPMTSVGEIGEDGVGLRDGLLMISVFTPANTGMKTGATFADRLEALFRRKEIDDIWFDEPNSNPVGIDDSGYYHILMTVDFHNWVGE